MKLLVLVPPHQINLFCQVGSTMTLPILRRHQVELRGEPPNTLSLKPIKAGKTGHQAPKLECRSLRV